MSLMPKADKYQFSIFYAQKHFLWYTSIREDVTDMYNPLLPHAKLLQKAEKQQEKAHDNMGNEEMLDCMKYHICLGKNLWLSRCFFQFDLPMGCCVTKIYYSAGISTDTSTHSLDISRLHCEPLSILLIIVGILELLTRATQVTILTSTD